MEHSRVTLPEPSYLDRISEVAYTISSMEWTILGDLQRLVTDLPDTLSIDRLEPEMTSGIATQIKAATTDMAGGSTKMYLVAVYRALSAAAEIRNDVLHARPDTHPSGCQRLMRAETTNRQTTSVRFWIDDECFDEAIVKLNNLLTAINDRLKFGSEVESASYARAAASERTSQDR
ncbi:hypothetical protein IV500_18700 [Paeniglutamicibacter antarcticus]|uniref:Uncharacterized protein n=1 Tax=Arthrobacter terrae TaxID=2935737 RepID=A0A931CSF6_9MICC|nr:hypothetical protein [Arthrobacter terrae]MBG0741396.1 hypothetical protein [Arthrobacter terrae]